MTGMPFPGPVGDADGLSGVSAPATPEPGTEALSAAQKRGKSNRRRGADAERDLVRWLRANGFPGAERAVRTGYRTGGRCSADHGDVTGTPGICWQAKYLARGHQPAVRRACLLETEDQREASGADLGVLVLKRRGVTDPGQWTAYLVDGDQTGALKPQARTLAGVVADLRRQGYGDSLDSGGGDAA